MKFMLFATTAFAASAIKRQVSVVEDAISAISSATSALDEGIKGFNGIEQAGSLESAASAVVDAINTGNTNVAAIDVLGNEAAGLAGPIQDLAALVQTTVSDLSAKKSTFSDAGVGQIVYQQAVQLRDAASTFQTTVLSKVPDNLQDLGAQLAQPITDALNQAVSDFQEFENGNGGGSSSTTGGEPSSTTGPSESATGAPTYGATTTAAPTTTGGSVPSYTTTTSAVASYTGAAVVNAANGYGAVAMAVLAGAAML